MYKLNHAGSGLDVVFVSVEGGLCAGQKLADMGLIPGEKLTVLHNPGCGPVTVLIKGAKIALGQGIASRIIVKEG